MYEESEPFGLFQFCFGSMPKLYSYQASLLFVYLFIGKKETKIKHTLLGQLVISEQTMLALTAEEASEWQNQQVFV